MVHRRKTTRGCNTKGGRRRRTNRKTLKRGVKIGGNDLRNQSPYIKDRGIKELNELVPMTNDEIMATPYGCIVYLFNCNPNGDILRENTDKNYCYVRSDKESRTASILLQEYVISTGKKFSEYDVSYEIRYINGEELLTHEFIDAKGRYDGYYKCYRYPNNSNGDSFDIMPTRGWL